MDFDFGYRRRRRNDSAVTFLTGFATGLFAGAIAMFIFDPDQGRRRRAIARDKAVSYGNQVAGFATGTAKDLGNRASLVSDPVGAEGAKPL